MIRVCLIGLAQTRQPLAYPAIRAHCPGIAVTDDPAAADLLVVAHTNDLRREGARLYHLMAATPRLQLVLLSEEPYWDTLAAKDPFARYQSLETPHGPLPYAFLNHHTSAIFAFDRIPAFLLTDPRYIAHYRPLFARNAALSAQDWAGHFRKAPVDAAFIAEKRDRPKTGIRFQGRDVFGLSHRRTQLAATCRGAHVLRAGKGWEEGPARQELPDWHADKLARLDLRCRYISAFENTHQRHYVSEKFTDAFAAGGVPLYCAGPGQGAERLADPAAWINLYGTDPAAAFDAMAQPTPALCAAYAAAQARFSGLFADDAAITAEYARLAGALTAALAALVR